MAGEYRFSFGPWNIDKSVVPVVLQVNIHEGAACAKKRAEQYTDVCNVFGTVLSRLRSDDQHGSVRKVNSQGRASAVRIMSVIARVRCGCTRGGFDAKRRGANIRGFRGRSPVGNTTVNIQICEALLRGRRVT